MIYYRVKNWERFQHYKDRNPPWIKLHFELLSSRDWVILADASRVLAIACMLIASRNEGLIPDDKEYIKRVAYLNVTPDFTPLLECGFLEPIKNIQADASVCKQMLADARPEAEAEAEAEAETETETETEKEVGGEPKKDSVQPPEPPESPDDPIILEIPTKIKDKYYQLRQSKLSEYEETYPAVDVLAEIRKARQWLIDNPGKRKSNIPSFLTHWLNNDKGSNVIRAPTGSGRRYKGTEQAINSPEHKQWLIDNKVLG